MSTPSQPSIPISAMLGVDLIPDAAEVVNDAPNEANGRAESLRVGEGLGDAPNDALAALLKLK